MQSSPSLPRRKWRLALAVAVGIILVYYFLFSSVRSESVITIQPATKTVKIPVANNPLGQLPSQQPEASKTATDLWQSTQLEEAFNQISHYYRELETNCSRISKNRESEAKYFYAYVCGGMCGGFGDRIRGVLTTFYLALMSKNCFTMKWTNPMPLEYSFEFSKYDVNMNRAKQVNAVDDFLNVLTPESVVAAVTTKEDVLVRTNSFQWKEIVQNPHFDTAMKESFPLLSGLNDFELAHIALRIIFSHPTKTIQDKVDSYVRQLDKKNSLTIGIQMRLNEGRYGPPQADNFKFSSNCFAEEMARMCIEYYRNATHTAGCSFFLTSDLAYESEVAEMKKTLASRLGSKGISFKLIQSEGAPSHLDRDSTTAERHAKTFIDWLMLQKTHLLIISRSGYGETSSWYSKAPTVRYLAGKNQGSFKKCVFREAAFDNITSYLYANDF